MFLVIFGCYGILNTMNKIKEDNYDIYKEFSNDLVNSLKSVKSQVDTFDFINEIRYIQKNKIDDNLNKINNIFPTLPVKGKTAGIVFIIVTL